jgi:hypothetical protein
MLEYSADSISPDFNVGFDVSLGGDAAPSARITGGVGTPGTCTNCGTNRFIAGLSLPVILVAIAILVLALRR